MSNDFSMYQGETICLDFIATTPAGAVINLTSGNLYWSYALNSLGQPYVNKSTLSTGISVTNPLVGTFMITIYPIDTEGRAGPHYHEIRFIDVSGQESVLGQGTMNIISSIT